MARTLVTAGAVGLRYSPMCSFGMNWGKANTGLSVKPRDPFRSPQCWSAQGSQVQLSWHSLTVSQNFMKTWGNAEDDIRGGGSRGRAQALCMCSGGLMSWLNGILLLPSAFLSIGRSDVRGAHTHHHLPAAEPSFIL